MNAQVLSEHKLFTFINSVKILDAVSMINEIG